MRISVFGLGYVGCVSAACLARDSHEVIGIDTNLEKVALLEAARSPIKEAGLDEVLGGAVHSGRLRATSDARAAVRFSDVSLICVGTPSCNNGNIDLRYVEQVSREIGSALAGRQGYHLVVVRSTVLPGTVEERLLPNLERCSGKRAGEDFGICMNPEFLREGSALFDHDHPSLVVIGEFDEASGDMAESLYGKVDVPIIRTSIRAAEMLKYANNAFHALKVTFANEIGTLCKAQGIDGQEVMDILCRDQRLNISPVYLRPGFAFGGSCLPKDTRALLYRSKERDVDSPLLAAVLASNERHIRRGLALVQRSGRRKVGVLGLSFKAGTDDVRESPIVSMVETLIGRGYQLSIYDEQIELGCLMGANRSFLEREIPHIASLMCSSMKEVVARAEIVILANDNAVFQGIRRLLREDQLLIDLTGIAKHDGGQGGYEGICW